VTSDREERGTAVVEIAILGSLIFGVLIHVVVVFGALHRATLATSSAAREYGRASVVADSEAEAATRGDAAVELAGRNHGLAPGSLHASLAGVRRRGEVLVVKVRTEVPIAAIPFLGSVGPGLAVPVEATHAVRIDRYRSGG
jgi:phosphotransferase system  glucose/maltose/N-acetylglucosamine-specific IIC component